MTEGHHTWIQTESIKDSGKDPCDEEFRAHVRMLVYEPIEPLVLCLARWLAKYLL